MYNLKAKYHMSDIWLLKIFILWAVSLLSCFPCCAGAVNCMHSCLSSLAIVSWYWNLFLEYLCLCLYLEVKTWLQWFTLFIMGVLKLLKMELLLLFLSWQVRHWYIRNLLVLYVDFCVLLLCWKFSESAHRDNFTSPLVICAFSFHSPVFLLYARIQELWWIRMGKKGTPVFFQIWGGAPEEVLSFSHVISLWLEDCQIWALLSWHMLLLFQVFWGGFFIMGGF